MMKSIGRVGIFGGTFNPVDNAHITIAKQFISELNIDKCYIIPANISPFKTNNNDTIEISSAHRIEMLKLAFNDNQKFIIDTYEIEKGGVSYSIDTIQYIKSKHPNSDIFILIGSDHAVSFKEWKEWEWILKNTQLCIAMRKGFSSPDEISEFLKIDKKTPKILRSPLIQLSATEIRQKLLKSETIHEFIPHDVEDYINSNKLYSKNHTSL